MSWFVIAAVVCFMIIVAVMGATDPVQYIDDEEEYETVYYIVYK